MKHKYADSYEIVDGQFYRGKQVYRNKKTGTPYTFLGNKHPARLLKAVCGICRKPIWKSYHCKGLTSVCGDPFCVTEINRQKNTTLADGDTFVCCGYRYICADNHFPELKRKRYLQEHRYVMEKHLGRPLVPKEVIHHINFDKLDNSLPNLSLCSASQHIKAERSLHDLVKELMARGVVKFDHEKKVYTL